MGNGHSSEEGEESSKVFDTRCIAFDEDGNLRLGDKPRNREAELKRVADADDPDDKPGKVWYIVDAQWMRSWLAYAHFNKASPAPGPVRNDSLLEYDAETEEWTPKQGLQPASRSAEGDFRRVNKEVWEVYKELYGGGPAIYVDRGDPNDPANWLVEPGFKNRKVVKKQRKVLKQRRGSKGRNESVESTEGAAESKAEEEHSDTESSHNAKQPLFTGGSTKPERETATDPKTAGAKSHDYVEDRTVSKQQRQDASAFFGTTTTTPAAATEPVQERKLESVPEEIRPASTTSPQPTASTSSGSPRSAATTNAASEKTLKDAAPRSQDKLSKGEMLLFS